MPENKDKGVSIGADAKLLVTYLLWQIEVARVISGLRTRMPHQITFDSVVTAVSALTNLDYDSAEALVAKVV